MPSHQPPYNTYQGTRMAMGLVVIARSSKNILHYTVFNILVGGLAQSSCLLCSHDVKTKPSYTYLLDMGREFHTIHVWI